MALRGTGRFGAVTQNPWIPITIAALAWGSAPAANRSVLLRGVDPFTIFPLKQLIGSVVIIGTLALAGNLSGLDRDTFKAGAAIGIFNMTIPTILFTMGFQVIPASIGAVIVGIIPLTTILLTHWVVPGEKFKVARVPGLLMAVLGVGVMGWAPVGEPSSQWVGGVVMMTIGSVSAGLGGALTPAVCGAPSELSPDRFPVPDLHGHPRPPLDSFRRVFGIFHHRCHRGLADRLHGGGPDRRFLCRLHVGLPDYHRGPGGPSPATSPRYWAPPWGWCFSRNR